MLTSFVPIRINEKNFKEYLDDYVKVLVNPYETDEKKIKLRMLLFRILLCQSMQILLIRLG